MGVPVGLSGGVGQGSTTSFPVASSFSIRRWAAALSLSRTT